MERVTEPELMEDPEQALAYHRADFSAAHGQRMAIFARLFPQRSLSGAVLDLGCGSGDVLLRFARAHPQARFLGVDGSRAMLALAQQELERDAALKQRVQLLLGIIPQAPLPATPWQLIMSHSLLHQLHHPEVLWQTIQAQGRAGTAVFVADLRRPTSAAEAERIVAQTSGDEPQVLKQDFYNSLCAAFEPEEVREQLRCAGLYPRLQVQVEPPTHLMIHGVL